MSADMTGDPAPRIEPSGKRVRALRDGVVVADTTRPLLVWEIPYYPSYYLPAGDVRVDAVRDVVTESAHAKLAGYLKLTWDAMDAWFEEDEEVYVHPRSPYTRVDIVGSSRHVRVELDGVTVVDSRRPTLLFETGLPTRYYLPKPDTRLDLLAPSGKVTECPYKGKAEYWSVHAGATAHADLVWSYRVPLPESQKITGLLCFPQERADTYVDGQLLE